MRKYLLALCLLLLGSSAFIGGWFWSYLSSPSQGSGEVVVNIPRGTGVRAIGELLAENNLLRNDIRFLVLARLTGSAQKLRAGEYRMQYGLTPMEVLQILQTGEVVRHRITVPEGLSLVQIAEIFAKGGWVDPVRFVALAHDSEYIATMGVQQKTLEGYLFPDTYTVIRGEVDEHSLMTMMVQRFFDVWSGLQVPDSMALSRHQIVTLGSIVEKETGAAVERPLIARVFLNRLARRMRLQSDPTVIYGLEQFDGNLTKADLRRSTPYNTYTIPALPPGPICSPGRAALDAVLHPVASDALYFVSRNNGTHVFSKTLAEHNRAVRKYQKRH